MDTFSESDFDIKKSLILPVNSKRELFVQDRRGHKKPDWGYFGGGIEPGETPLEAVIRESKEELCINLKESDLVPLGISTTSWDDVKMLRYLYLYRTDQVEFDVREGKGGLWLTFDEARERMDGRDLLDDVVARINRALDAA
ncbi:MAG: NUDIX domain-containing protein [Patescibacteria group bacterium]